MEVIHRLLIRATNGDLSELRRMGVSLDIPQGQAGQLLTLEIPESAAQWGHVREWIARRRPADLVRTEFTSRELASATWLSMDPAWHHGYPEPDPERSGYLAATYDLTEYCEQCGIGKRQRAPFRMKAEPRWGTRGILQLNWVFDEYFVKPDVWSEVFQPYGIDRRPVLNAAGDELRTVVQLVVRAEVTFVTDGLPMDDVCGSCDRPKYLPVVRGPLPPLREPPHADIAKSREYFGSGGRAFHEVVVSGSLCRSISEHRVRGAVFTPVANALEDVRYRTIT
jgi:hypothetical protein